MRRSEALLKQTAAAMQTAQRTTERVRLLTMELKHPARPDDDTTRSRV
jgi:hypothetical protein